MPIVAGFTLLKYVCRKAHFCDAHHILKPAGALASPASIKFIGWREIAMTLTEFFVSADATPLERRGLLGMAALPRKNRWEGRMAKGRA